MMCNIKVYETYRSQVCLALPRLFASAAIYPAIINILVYNYCQLTSAYGIKFIGFLIVMLDLHGIDKTWLTN